MVHCESQEELDYYWDKLTEGGAPEYQQCGWLKDKFGVSWQITPTILLEMISDPDRTKANRAFQALMEMGKLDIAELERAFRGD
jgi:predicted 3-demethylubiquinone-9 3-methyltransferase (glyoxalase superfamily)